MKNGKAKWKGPLEDCKRGSLRDIELPKYIIKTDTMSFSHVLNFQISGNMDEQLQRLLAPRGPRGHQGLPQGPQIARLAETKSHEFYSFLVYCLLGSGLEGHEVL